MDSESKPSVPGTLSSAVPQAAAASVSVARQKRKQVARACDECRTYRIKCDTGNPCANCRRKGRKCSNGTADGSNALEKELIELRGRVEVLQRALRHERSQTAKLPPTPEDDDASSAAASVWKPSEQTQPKRLFNYGVSLRAPRRTNDSFLGPSSLYFFTTRLVRPLSLANHETAYADSLIPRYGSSEELTGEATLTPPASEPSPITSNADGEWTQMQEQYFTDRYWESVHTCILPILSEAEFKLHHQSLWSSSDGPRKPSALVDIVIALCMQLGLPAASCGGANSERADVDNTLAGQKYYRRAQALLSYEMENPSLATLQSHLLCALYVCAGSFHNMVDITISLAVRTAFILGLHLDPPATMPRKEQENRRRLWWATYLLESKISTKLGRPFGIDASYVMPELPSDDAEAAMLAGSMFAPIGPEETWLSFNKYHIGLYQVNRESHVSFYDTCAAVSDDQNIWKDADTLQACAESLRPHMESMERWRDSVPKCLRTRRREGGETLSTDGTPVEIEGFAPLWLQRQCLLLELTYHHLSINILRPLISFSAAPGPGSLAQELANRSALHAIAYTKILHQVLTTSKVLDSWNESFHWQWNASLTLIGFVLSNPPAPQVVNQARHAIELSVKVCDIYAENFFVASRASKSIRELMDKVDHVLSLRQNQTQQVNLAGLNAMNLEDLGIPAFLDPPMTEENPVVPIDEGIFDVVMGVDFWNDMDEWWPSFTTQMGGYEGEAMQLQV